jgi:hypothetical protein
MSRSSRFVITLSDADRGGLQRRARCYTAPHAGVVRAKVVLLAAEGLDVHVGVVSRWRKRFAQEGMSGLADRPRGGRPRVFPAAVVAEVKAMACGPPQDRDVPQSRWSARRLHQDQPRPGAARPRQGTLARAHRRYRPLPRQVRQPRRLPGQLPAQRAAIRNPPKKPSTAPAPAASTLPTPPPGSRPAPIHLRTYGQQH